MKAGSPQVRALLRKLQRSGLPLMLSSGLLPQPLPPLEQLGAAERPLWQQRLHWPEAAEQRWRETHPAPENSGLAVYALEGPLYLVRVEISASTWQSSQLFYLYDRRSEQGRLLSLAWIGLDLKGRRLARQGEEIAGLVAFEAHDQILRVLALARQAGDCGELIRWRFHQGRPFLKEVRARLCSEVSAAAEIDPARWPRIWP